MYTRIHVHLISEHASILEARRRRSMNIETFPFLGGSVIRSFESDHTATMLLIRVCFFSFVLFLFFLFLMSTSWIREQRTHNSINVDAVARESC